MDRESQCEDVQQQHCGPSWNVDGGGENGALRRTGRVEQLRGFQKRGQMIRRRRRIERGSDDLVMILQFRRHPFQIGADLLRRLIEQRRRRIKGDDSGVRKQSTCLGQVGAVAELELLQLRNPGEAFQQMTGRSARVLDAAGIAAFPDS